MNDVKITGLDAGSRPAAIQPTDLAIVEKRPWDNTTDTPIVTSDFVSPQKEAPGRYLKVFGLLHFLEDDLPVRWVLVDTNRYWRHKNSLSSGQPEVKPLWDFPVTGRVEYQDFDNMPAYLSHVCKKREREVAENVWINAFMRLFCQYIFKVYYLDRQRITIVSDFSQAAESREGFDLNSDVQSLISHRISFDLLVRRFDHHYAPYIKWLSYSELRHLYKADPEQYGPCVSQVLRYFMGRPTCEQDIERALTDSLRKIYYTKRSWDSEQYTIHTGGPFQSDAAYIRGGDRYYELPEKHIAFIGNLADARRHAEMLVEQQIEENPALYDGKKLDYWITDEIGTIYY